MKKSGLLTIIIVVLAILIALPIAIKVKNAKDTPKDDNQPVLDSKLVKNIDNLELSTKEIPELTLEITGRYETTLKLNEITEYVPVYEFDAGIVDIFGTHVNKYVGIKYADLIKYLNMPYSTITMFVSDRKKVSYRPSEIDYEKTFIVFSMDDKSINTSKMTLLAVNYNYLYSVENLTSIDYQE